MWALAGSTNPLRASRPATPASAIRAMWAPVSAPFINLITVINTWCFDTFWLRLSPIHVNRQHPHTTSVADNIMYIVYHPIKRVFIDAFWGEHFIDI